MFLNIKLKTKSRIKMISPTLTLLVFPTVNFDLSWFGFLGFMSQHMVNTTKLLYHYPATKNWTGLLISIGFINNAKKSLSTGSCLDNQIFIYLLHFIFMWSFFLKRSNGHHPLKNVFLRSRLSKWLMILWVPLWVWLLDF